MTFANIAQLGKVTPKTQTATADVLAAAGRQGIQLAQVWGVGGGDHADGYASDFMVYGDQAAGDWIADYIWANRGRLGVRWIIWRQRIRSTTPGKPGTWQLMEDRGSSTQNHMDHVHVKWNAAPVLSPATRPRIRVSQLHPGASGPDVKLYNQLLWAKQGWRYKAANLAAWLRESSNVYGPMTAKVTSDTYAYLTEKDPSRWGGRQTHAGAQLVAFLGAEPV